MSIARIYTSKTVRKDWVCGKCGDTIRKGLDGRRSFAVGFRGYEQTRCMKQECTPTRAELESSSIASIYDAIDSADLSACQSLEDLESVRDDVVSAIQEVADEYESNEMFEVNYDLQERVETLQAAADELGNWVPEDDEPDEDEECEECSGTGRIPHDDPAQPDQDCDECETTGRVEVDPSAREEWLEEARESLQAAMDDMELP